LKGIQELTHGHRFAERWIKIGLAMSTCLNANFGIRGLDVQKDATSVYRDFSHVDGRVLMAAHGKHYASLVANRGLQPNWDCPCDRSNPIFPHEELLSRQRAGASA
jgi:hypothetical protein